MNLKVIWASTAKNSYYEEINFIYFKWNSREVVKFEKLVTEEIQRIISNPLIGKISYNDVYSLSISKQTTLFYKIDKDSNLIELLLFWNNLKNPQDLTSLL
ncbi:type II toxin-antitoxin system RelE/ParE family toxin [Flavobacterium sp.]|jgi:plasmid stabilization system protein ParE|uniref:type II toxin-antitoxin system RelE/ParE family toxin n=1 Tax=Flavobacterium sp. TaxID=239 RepID=UPI0037C0FB79